MMPLLQQHQDPDIPGDRGDKHWMMPLLQQHQDPDIPGDRGDKHWMMPLLQQHTGFRNFWIPGMTFSKRQEKLLVQTRSTHSRRQSGHHWYPSFKENISSRFATYDIVSALAIFYTCNIPSPILLNFPLRERSQPLREI